MQNGCRTDAKRLNVYAVCSMQGANGCKTGAKQVRTYAIERMCMQYTA